MPHGGIVHVALLNGACWSACPQDAAWSPRTAAIATTVAR
jgi:hypothetical protein